MIYVALDFPNWNKTKEFIDNYQMHGIPVKVGMELFYKEGPKLIERLKENNHPIFLDLKLHDIPTTVRRAMKNIASLEVDMVNVHALGGKEMIESAKEGLIAGTSSNHIPAKLVAVTLLTSLDQHSMNRELLMPGTMDSNTVHFAKMASESGADGVVCSVYETNQIKETCGANFLTVTPGIRLEDNNHDDQKRVATPLEARRNKVDRLVIGRSITRAKNPLQTFKLAMKEWGKPNEYL